MLRHADLPFLAGQNGVMSGFVHRVADRAIIHQKTDKKKAPLLGA
jgi:hypothetical protein